MALRMKQNKILCTVRTTHHTGDTVVNAPSRDPSDFGLAHKAESALFLPEKTKLGTTPERIQHVRTFPCFEVGFIRRIVRVGFALNLNVSFDGRASRE